MNEWDMDHTGRTSFGESDMTQPEALRLSQVAPYLEGGERGQWIVAAAAELRRLHDLNQELLAALKQSVNETLDYIKRNHLTGAENNHWIVQARAAIAKGEAK
jgi:hypothetical protein